MTSQALGDLFRRLEETDLPCMVGGSVAAMLFGEIRFTLDIDLVVAAMPEDAERIAAAFPADRFYVPPVDVIRHEIDRGQRGMFNILDDQSGLKADIYLAGDDELIAYGLEHAVERELAGVRLRVAPATYVVAMKLRYHALSRQDKHLRDIRGMLAHSPELIDQRIVVFWAEKAGVDDVWRSCLNRVGEE